MTKRKGLDMAKIATVIAAGLAVFVLIVVSISGAGTANAAVMDRCVVCHPRAHVDAWSESHANLLALDPQQGAACTRCHTTAYCNDCHTKAAAGASSAAPATGQELVATKCSTCHSLSTVQAARKDKAGWASTIDRMTRHGLSADVSQKQMMLEYLSGQ